MGLLLSVVLSYAGIIEARECIKHILAGMLPDSEPDFQDLVLYYSRLLKQANVSTSNESWAHGSGQGYLCLTEDDEGHLKSATVKYYDGSQPDSAAILFSTKISSFGQESVDSNVTRDSNGTLNASERYTNASTKTLITNTSESFNVGLRNRSTTPSYEHVSDPIHFSEDSFEPNRSPSNYIPSEDALSPDDQNDQGNTIDPDELYSDYSYSKNKEDNETYEKDRDSRLEITSDSNTVDQNLQESENYFDEQDKSEKSDTKEKLTWCYRPRSPMPQNLPEIHFQSYDGIENKSDPAYSEDFLRSLDGIKYRPLQRSEQTGRRRSFKKRHSSSSTSSKDSRASREEELKMFTSLEEAEFELMGREDSFSYRGNRSNLSARSISRSRSRENSKERRNESQNVDTAESADLDDHDTKPRLKDIPKLSSFEEEKETENLKEVTETKDDEEAEEEEVDDFWGNSGD